MYPSSLSPSNETTICNNVPTVNVPSPQAPNNIVPLSADFNGAPSQVRCINASRSFVIGMSGVALNQGLTIIASGGSSISVSCDDGTQIESAASVTVQPGTPLSIIYNGSAWVAWQ